MNKVLVTGATGFIGYEVARQLAERCLRPRLMVRRLHRGPQLAGLDAELIHGDLESPASLRRAVAGVDTILHLGARATFEDYRLLKPSIVKGSRDLMEAAADAGVKSLVFSSSLLVYGESAEPITADTPARPELDYGRAKLETERVLAEMAAKHGVAFAALRLPHVYGAMDLMFTQLRDGLVVFPGAGKNTYAHLHVEDAARLMIECGAQRWSGVTPVADEHPADWQEFFGVVRRYHPRLKQLTLPRWLCQAGTYALKPYQKLTGRQMLYTTGAVHSWNMNLPVASDLLWGELALAPKHPSIYQGIPAVLDACVAWRWLHPVYDPCGA